MDKKLEYCVLKEDAGKTMKQILHEKMHLTVRQVRSIKFSDTGLLINGEKYLIDEQGRRRYVTTGVTVREGDRISAFFQEEAPAVLPEEGELKVLWEDQDLVFLDKPAGLVCHPAGGHFTDTLVNRLAAKYVEPTRLIGRLDKETSGVIIASRNAVAAHRLEEQRKTKTLSRQYIALVEGEMEGSGICDYPLVRCKLQGKVGDHGKPLSLMMPVHLTEESQREGEILPSATMWQSLGSGEYLGKKISLIRLHLLSGRTHQIRTHMAALGHPLLGDGLYGNGPVEGAARCMLHSEEILCEHPFTAQKLQVTAPWPEDFKTILSVAFSFDSSDNTLRDDL